MGRRCLPARDHVLRRRPRARPSRGRRTGRRGEELAAAHLQRRGFTILDRNVRTRYGEIDLVACDGRGARVRRGQDDPSAPRRSPPLERVGRRAAGAAAPARAQLAAGAARRGRSAAPEVRFDAIGVVLDARGRAARARAPRGRVVTAGMERRPAADALQRELLVGERLEGHAVQRRDALAFDRLAVRGRRVADVLGEAPAGVLAVGVAHEAVARDLGDDRGGGDRRARRVAVDDRALLAAEVRHREAVEQAQHLAADAVGDAARRVAQRREVGLVQAARVDAAHAARDDDDPRGGAHHERVERLARLDGVLLGVVERAEQAQLARGQRLVVEQHPGRHQRPGQAAATGLVGAGDQPEAEAAVEGEQPPAAAARRARAGASARVAGRPALEEADPVGRPVGEEGAADDPARGDWSPEAAVVGFATVVAHHEPVAGRNLDRRREVAHDADLLRAGFDVGVALPFEGRLALRLAVDVAFADVDFVARAGDDPLDEVRARVLLGVRLVARPPSSGAASEPHCDCSAPSGGWKTTISPTWGPLKSMPMRFTSTRWPTDSVGSIEPLGIR